MRKYFLSLILAILTITALPAAAFAEDSGITEDAGITPDSPFYFAEGWIHGLSLAFTFGEASKAQKALGYAEEHLAEMKAMAEQNRVQAMEKAASEYGNDLEIATRNMEKSMNEGTETAQQIAERMSAHISFMYNNSNQQDGEAASLMTQVRESAQNCQESTIRTMAAGDAENALRLNLNLMLQQCTRADNENGGQAVQQYERLKAMNEEIIAIAAKQGKGSEAQSIADGEVAGMERVMAEIRTRSQNTNQVQSQGTNGNQQSINQSGQPNGNGIPGENNPQPPAGGSTGNPGSGNDQAPGSTGGNQGGNTGQGKH